MSSFDVHPPEMHGNGEFDDSEVEALLAGGSGDGSPLAAFVGRLRTSASLPAPEVGPELAAVFAVGLTSTEKGDLPVTAASNADGPGFQAAGLPNWRRRRMLSTFVGTLVGKLVIGGVAAAATTGALGAAGALPDPVQSAVSDVVSVVGVQLPDPDDDASDPDEAGPGDLDDDGAGVATDPAAPLEDQTGPGAGSTDDAEDADHSDEGADDSDNDADDTDDVGDDVGDDDADDADDSDEGDEADEADEADSHDDSDADAHADADDDSDEGDDDTDDRMTTAGSTAGSDPESQDSETHDDDDRSSSGDHVEDGEASE